MGAGERQVQRRWARRRSFVAKGAPLDDGQIRFGRRTKRLGEKDRLEIACGNSTAFEAGPSLRVGMTAFFWRAVIRILGRAWGRCGRRDGLGGSRRLGLRR